MVVMAGVSWSKRSVSQISARSALEQVLLPSMKGTRDGLPLSSSPSKKRVHAGGELAVDGDPGAAGLHEGHELALVVGGAAAADHAALRGVLQLRLEGRGVPEVERVHGLHVVVAVEEDVALALAAVAHDHGAAGGGVLWASKPMSRRSCTSQSAAPRSRVA
jgi:hypothetical protein